MLSNASIYFKQYTTFLLVIAFVFMSLFPLTAQTQAQTSVRSLDQLVDGDVIKTADNNDVYIIKIVETDASTAPKRFKRLIINPEIFESYGHLSWSDIRIVSQATLNAFTLSDLVMEVNEDGTPTTGNIYRLYASEDDSGMKSHMQITPTEFEEMGLDWDSVFLINHIEAGDDFYETMPPIQSQEQYMTHSNIPANRRVALTATSTDSAGDVSIASVPATTPPTQPATPPTQPATPPTTPATPPAPPTITQPPATSGGGSSGSGSGAFVFSSVVDDDLSAPSSFRVASSNFSSIALSWRKESGARQGYELQWCVSGCGADRDWDNVYRITSSSVTRHTLSGLTNASKYKIRIRSIKNPSDVSKWRTITASPDTAVDASLFMVGRRGDGHLYSVDPTTGLAQQIGQFDNAPSPVYNYDLRLYRCNPRGGFGSTVNQQRTSSLIASLYCDLTRINRWPQSLSPVRYSSGSGGFGRALGTASALAMADDGTLFMAAEDEGGYIYTLDPVTAQATLYGTQDDGLGVDEYYIEGLAFSPDGTLYMVGEDTAKLYTIHFTKIEGKRCYADENNGDWGAIRCSPQQIDVTYAKEVGGAGSQTAGFGVDEWTPRGITFIGNTLYMVGDSNAKLYELSTTTGAATPIGNAEYFEQNIYFPSSLTSIGNTLYLGAGDTPYLFTLDPHTGIATPVNEEVIAFGVVEIDPGGLVGVVSAKAPTGVELEVRSATSISLSWDAMPKASGYVVQYCPVEDDECVADDDGNVWRSGGTTTSTTRTVTNLENNTTYRFRVGTTRRGYPAGWTTTRDIKTHSEMSVSRTHAYAILTGNSQQKYLSIVDLETGIATEVGGAGSQAAGFGVGETNPVALALSADGTLYMIGPITDKLYTLNTATGAATEVGGAGSQTAGFGVGETSPTALAFAPDGKLYMLGTLTSNLYTLDTATGEATAVIDTDTDNDPNTLQNRFGNGEISPGGLAFVGNTLYLFGNNNDKLYTLDISTGRTTLVGPSATPVSGFLAVGDITTIGDTIYATEVGTDKLYTINTDTGAFTVVGSATNFGVSAQNPLAITRMIVPTPPNLLAETGATPTSVIIRWDPVLGAQSYQVQHCATQASGDCVGNTWVDDGDTTDTFKNLAGLSPNTAYKVRIGNKKTGRDTSWSASSSFRTLREPFVSTIGDITITSIEVEWATVSDASEYKVQYCPVRSNVCTTAWITATDAAIGTDYTIENLTPNKDYRTRVVALGSSDEELTASAPQDAKTLAPVIRYTATVLPTSIVLDWNEVSGATQYKVQYCESSVCPTWIDATTTTEKKYAIQGLTMDKVYKVRVGAEISGSDSWSVVKSLRPSPYFRYEKMQYQQDGTWSLHLRWNTIPGASSYHIAVCSVRDDSPCPENGGNWTSDHVTVTGTRAVIGWIKSGEKYKFRLTAQGPNNLNIKTIIELTATPNVDQIPVIYARTERGLLAIEEYLRYLYTRSKLKSTPSSRLLGYVYNESLAPYNVRVFTPRQENTPGGSLVVQWSKSSHSIATAYDVQYCTGANCDADGSGWTDFTPTPPQEIIGSGVVITGLTPSTEYKVRVRGEYLSHFTTSRWVEAESSATTSSS